MQGDGISYRKGLSFGGMSTTRHDAVTRGDKSWTFVPVCLPTSRDVCLAPLFSRIECTGTAAIETYFNVPWRLIHTCPRELQCRLVKRVLCAVSHGEMTAHDSERELIIRRLQREPVGSNESQ